MEELNINHHIVRFLREKFGFSVAEVVKYANIKDIKPQKDTPGFSAENYMMYIERGELHPKKYVIDNLVKLYKVPFLTFFLEKLPVFDDELIDFRTFDSRVPVKDSPVLFAIKRKIKLLQQQLSYIEKVQNNTKRDFVSSVAEGVSIESFVAHVRDVIGFSVEEQRKLRKNDNLFKIIRQKIESVGIFVIQLGNLGSYHTNLSTKDFRGIAISDEYAPLIIINPNDTLAAQLFSLLHELAHIFLGDTAISNSGLNDLVSRKEQICNAFAAEFLLPAEELKQFKSIRDMGMVLRLSSELASVYHVSNMVVIRRLYDTGKISKKLFGEANTIISKNFKQQTNKNINGGGPSRNVIDRAYLGERTIKAMNFATEVNLISPMTAAAVLGINVGRLYKVIS